MMVTNARHAADTQGSYTEELAGAMLGLVKIGGELGKG